MIKTFIFVEDGSVDLDELKSSVGDDVLVIPYRQGATPPAIQQPREPVSRREVKTDAIMQKNRADMLKEKNINLQEGLKKAVEDVAERIKMAFYYEFDELIPSTMADKIDEIVKEVLNEHEL